MAGTTSQQLTAADLVGTWRLIGTTSRDLETGEVEVYGGHSGTIMYGVDGRMSAVLVRGVRRRPESGQDDGC
jgi:hypothetical protein